MENKASREEMMIKQESAGTARMSLLLVCFSLLHLLCASANSAPRTLIVEGGVARTPIRPNEHVVRELRKAAGSKVLRRLPDHIIVTTQCRNFHRGCSQEFVDFLESELRGNVGDEEADEIIAAASVAAEDKPYGRRGDPDVSTACLNFGKCASGKGGAGDSGDDDRHHTVTAAASTSSQASFSRLSVESLVQIESLRKVRALKERQLQALLEEQIIKGNQCGNLSQEAMLCELHNYLLVWASHLVQFYWHYVFLAAVPSLAFLALAAWVICPNELAPEHIEFLNSGDPGEQFHRYRLVHSCLERHDLQSCIKMRAALSVLCLVALVISIASLPRVFENTWFEWACSFLVPTHWLRSALVVVSFVYLSSSIVFPLKQCFSAWHELFAIDAAIEQSQQELFHEVVLQRREEQRQRKSREEDGNKGGPGGKLVLEYDEGQLVKAVTASEPSQEASSVKEKDHLREQNSLGSTPHEDKSSSNIGHSL
jgi:hypothetical protein